MTVTTGDTVRWSFDGSTLNHNVRGTGSNWTPPLNSTIGMDQDPVDYTFSAPGVYTFVCDVHGSGMSGTVTVEEPGADPLENVLVFSATAGFRHDSIPAGIAAITALGAANDFAVDATEDATDFTSSNLAQYDAVVFLSTTGNVLNDAQQEAFEGYMRSGGGFVGIHAAADTEYTWPWYGQMVGGYFRNHPPGTPAATVNIEDGNEPSTEGLPATWPRVDEWYNYQSYETPSVNGGGDDYSVRDSDVKVLATVDESTYVEEDGSDGTNDDHPISWCSDFDGGHVWYTGMGHTQESFGTEPGNIRSHILGGLETVTGAEESDCGEPRQATPTLDDFELVTVDDDTESPMELAVTDDGRVFYVERITGELNVYNPVNGQVTTALQLPVSSVQENGLMGIALDPNFETNNHLYVTYTPLTPNDQTRVSRFTVGANNVISAASEQIIFAWTAQRAECCHSGGSLAFGPDGDLYISTGDNTNPFASDGFAPIDERPGRAFWDAQRTSANSNNHNGKILRIHPLPGATGTPGIGTTYSIPTGNMFPTGTVQTLPEIFAMGFRNPFRITVDPHTGWVLVGNYGPDAPATVANRGPQGSVEFEVVKEPGFYGWPYCVRDNVPYNDFNFANGTSGPKFDCANLENTSPNNTGITDLPPAIPATMWMGYSETDPRFPGLGGGGAPTGGPRYDFDPALDNPAKFPESYDRHWFIGEWNNGWIKTATLDDEGAGTGVFDTPFLDTFFRPHEMEFGPDGSLYVIDWGDGFGGNNANSGIYRIDYVAGARRPIARATSDKDNGPTPLTVQFSSDGSQDPDGTSLTYAWDFDGNGTTDSTEANPTHTYNTAGTFNATLTVTDADGQTGFDTIPITAGNTRPTVTITIPTDGQFAAFGDIVPYEITVTDPEDGDIDCNDVTMSYQLGHDDHAHGLGQQQGCSGTFRTQTDSGHGANANIFTSIVASYTDEAQGAANALTGLDDVILHPKPKQAEFFDSTGRVAGSPAGGDPGVLTETTADAGAGLNIGFIERGDYVSFERMSLEELTGIRFRVASGGAGGTIEARLDSPTGELAGSVAVAPTGGWQNWANVTMDLPTPPAGTHELFLVFTHPTDNGGLFNLNYFTALGKGAANSAAPEVTASADPTGGDAPLEVQFTGTATDPDAGAGEQLTYLWDFGVAGTTDDTSTELSPSYTYERPGTYLARFTATDPNGASATTSVQVE
ncbi:MAG TPA: ThuA domain-containing protein, partial [Solirubrobacteraceae bacterium]|nr:ThuA domain-containing protein [Solirubrobacteraceae bacterium]